MTPLVSVIVPVLDEASALPGVLDHLASLPGRFEVLVADGGSADGSAEVARAHPLGARVIDAPRGRARQLNAAAEQAGGDALVFLHADSRLPRGAWDSVARALADHRTLGGAFALRFDGRDSFSRVLTAWYAVQRRAGIYYGDSTIWVRAPTFAALGGFRDLPIMDDYDFVRRMERRGRTVTLPGPALTSARRWRAQGVTRTVFSWVVIRWLYVMGVPPELLAALYRHIR